ncbi:MAG: tetratricopeptide repeat protein [Bacteroidetes bacterium]|nr:tetratricopeptide repeat protein [Bacteroidota bacterium]
MKTILIFFLLITGTLRLYAQLPSDKLFRSGYYYLQVDNDKAIYYLSKAIERDSTRAKYYYFRGIARYKKGDYEDSIDDFESANRLDTVIVITYMYQGMAYKNLGMYEEAGERIDKFINKSSQDSTGYAYLLRGKVHMAAGNYEEALFDFTLLTESFPDIASSNYYRLVAYLQLGDYTSALKDVNLLLAETPDFYGYYFYRGNVYFGMGKFRKAIEDYSTSLVHNKFNADAYYRRGMAFDTLSQHLEAIDNYTYAIAINASDGVYYSRRGNSRFSIGNREGACLDWTIAGNLGYYEDFDKVKRLCE